MQRGRRRLPVRVLVNEIIRKNEIQIEILQKILGSNNIYFEGVGSREVSFLVRRQNLTEFQENSEKLLTFSFGKLFYPQALLR